MSRLMCLLGGGEEGCSCLLPEQSTACASTDSILRVRTGQEYQTSRRCDPIERASELRGSTIVQLTISRFRAEKSGGNDDAVG